MKRCRLWWPRLIATAGLILLGIAYSYPFLWMVATSLKERATVFEQPLSLLPTSVVFSNYGAAWRAARLSRNFANTLLVATIATALTLLVTSSAGYVLGRMRFRGRQLIVAMFVVSLFMPRGYTIVPITTLVRTLGVDDSLWGVIIVSVGTSVVFNTLLFSAYFLNLSTDLEEAAVLDGASPPLVYAAVALPTALPLVAAIGILEYVENWNSFFMPLVLTMGRKDLQTVSVGIYMLMGQHGTNWPVLCAAAAIAIVPVVVLFVVLQRRFVDAVAGALRL